jgi:hypothetical protein
VIPFLLGCAAPAQVRPAATAALTEDVREALDVLFNVVADGLPRPTQYAKAVATVADALALKREAREQVRRADTAALIERLRIYEATTEGAEGELFGEAAIALAREQERRS